MADQTGRAVSFAYNGNDLSQVADANGKVETYAYTTEGSMVGLMTSSTLPLGNKPLTQVWDTSGKVTQQSDSHGNTTTYAYDPAGVAPTSITDPLGALQQQVHANYKTETSYTDANGNTISMGYDTNGHRTSVTDRMGDTTTATYHNPSGYLASVTDALGNTTTYTYATQVQGPFTFYVLTTIQYADGTSVSMAYDNFGNVTGITDAAGKVTKFTYNSHGQVLTATNSAGGVTTYTYNADATVASETDVSGNSSIFNYDNQKRPAQLKHPDGSAAAFTWDNRDNLLKVTDERGKVAATTYNDDNRIKSLTDPLGASTTLQYDTDERLSTLVDRAGKTTSLSYNELGSPKIRKNPAGEQTTFGYDKLNRLTTMLDGAGNALTFTYDKEDVLSSASDALGRTVTFTGDKLGRTTRLTTPLGEDFDNAYDSLGRLSSETDALSRTIKYGYDPRGLLTSTSLPLGVSASYTRSELGLIGSITDPNGNIWSQTFDAAGRLASSTDPLGRAISATYDNRNRLSGAKSGEGTVAFTYDPAGSLVRELYSDGTDLGFTFDDNNRLMSAPGIKFQYDANDRLISSNGVATARDDDGRIASLTYTNGQTVKYHYNALGLLDTITDWVGGSTTFSFDAGHQLVSIKRPNGTSTQYTYDQDGRLSLITESAGAKIALQRDAAGQITLEDRTLPQSPSPVAGTLPLAYDAAHQISGANYDGLGRLTKDGMRSYTWDLASRLTSYSGADGSATAAYDALGMRISNTAGGVTNKYVLNYALGLPSIATVQDGSGKDVRYYVHTPGGALLYSIEAADNQRHFFHFDEMGSTTFLTAAVTDSYGITAYGETVTTGPKNANNNPFTWLGMHGVMQEGSTGLYYMRARWYDSASARFLSKDPAPSLSPRAINPYQYALANPHSFVDPTGLDGESLNFSGYYTGMNPATCPAGNSTMGSAAFSTRILLRFSNIGLGVRLIVPGVVSLTLDCGENTNRRFTPGNSAGPDAAPVQGAWTGGYLVLLGTSDLQGNPGAFTTSLSPNLGNRSAPYKLFPFVTQASGFDTGNAIANTTTDPFGTAPQTGPVDLFFYGQVTGGGVPKTSPSRPNGPAPPARNPYEHFVVGDYVFNPAAYKESPPACTKGRTVADAATILSALVGVDPRDPSTGDYFSGCLVR